MVNISLILYTKGFFGSFLKSPTQMGSLSINNSVTNISRLGTFKGKKYHEKNYSTRVKLPIIVTIIIKKQTRQFREYYNLIILQTWPEYCVLVHTFAIWSMFIYHKE